MNITTSFCLITKQPMLSRTKARAQKFLDKLNRKGKIKRPTIVIFCAYCEHYHFKTARLVSYD